MPHFQMGRSEAEGLVRSAPHLAPAMLERARRDLRRWSTRVFQPDKRRFLEGYVSVLGPFVEGGTGTVLKGPHLPVQRAINPLDDDPRPTTRPPATRSIRAAEIPVSERPAAALEFDEVPAIEPLVSEVLAVEHTMPSDAVETVEVDIDIPDHPLEAAEVPPVPPSVPRQDVDSLALGVWKISGWSNAEPSAEESRDANDIPVQAPAAQAAAIAPPLPREDAPIDWGGVFNQMQGTGIVDLTAYDLLDQLGQLRELLDQWNEQNRGHVSSGSSRS